MQRRKRQGGTSTRHRIVIVGGGAAGLEAATRLGNGVAKAGKAEVILVDSSPSHFWKPRLHEVAAGRIDAASHQIDYSAHARRNHFRFELGALCELDYAARAVTIDQTVDSQGRTVLPSRQLGFDSLILAIGSVSNFFSTAGVAAHALTLENLDQAEKFKRRLLASLLRVGQKKHSAHEVSQRLPVKVTIIGGGATGVELAAALRGSAEMIRDYHMPMLNPSEDLSIRLIEGGGRLLPALPPRVSEDALEALRRLDVDVMLNCKVEAVTPDSVLARGGQTLSSDLTIWAAGVEGAPILRSLTELPLNSLGQVTVTRTLEVHTLPGVYALGDCASCIASEGNGFVPPRAQAAFQQAVYLSKALARKIERKSFPPFRYRDHGAFISFAHAGAVGAVKSGLFGEGLIVRGWLAALSYRYLYHQHILALTGIRRTTMYLVSQWLRDRVRPPVGIS
jgi:NADH:ubiquinone reductase (H+-translocating)